MRIRFTETPTLPRDLRHLAYRKDQEVTLTDDQAERWIRRGVAVQAAPAPAKAFVPPRPAETLKPLDPVKAPDPPAAAAGGAAPGQETPKVEAPVTADAKAAKPGKGAKA